MKERKKHLKKIIKKKFKQKTNKKKTNTELIQTNKHHKHKK